MNKKMVIWQILILLLIITSLAVNASKYINLDFNLSKQGLLLEKIQILEKNLYYSGLFFMGSPPEPTDYYVQFYDSDNVLLKREMIAPLDSVIFEFNPATFKIVIMNDTTPIISKSVNFCNNNGICEPCRSGNCELIENVLTCSDCESGGQDYYCDLYRDNICDPDCRGEEVDCEECRFCYFRGQNSLYTECKKDYGGEACTSRQRCTGRLISATDTGFYCCINGNCVTSEIPSDVPVEDSQKLNMLEIGFAFVLILLIILMVFLISKKRFVIKSKKR